ncbi:MAG: PEP-CTERM sorting domain-containing protein, partial [Rubrivivax sp.]|nr:PEP-CTERM sorting domain-containing protein [Rubrivivax sp.]
IAAVALAAAGAAGAATQTHVATFTGAGGDLTWGNGDQSVVTLVQGFLPLFDTALGTLNSVDVTLQGWRSLDFSCTQGMAGTMGGCNAAVHGRFVLDSINYPVWSFVDIAEVQPRSPAAVGLVPDRGQTLSALVYGEAAAAATITDPLVLHRHFTNATGNAPWVDYRLYFQGYDGGSIGQGGAAAITSLFWNGDATVTMSYQYTPAIPEPAAWALMLGGLGVVLRRASRRAQRAAATA